MSLRKPKAWRDLRDLSMLSYLQLCPHSDVLPTKRQSHCDFITGFLLNRMLAVHNP